MKTRTKVDTNCFNLGLNYPSLREGVKYYFADFVRKEGTPPPFTDFFRQGGSYEFGGYPPPPFYGFFPEKFSSKRVNTCVFCSKNT